VRTTNQAEMTGHGKIPKLWERFMAEGILEKIPGKTDGHIVNVYSNYESDENGEYSYLIGSRVRPTDKIPAGMVAREVPAKGYLERFANRMAGRLWVDETEAVIAKAELRLIETVTFVAGIAGAVYQLDCAFKRSRLDDGLWYTPEFTWSADWRELLSRKVVTVRETKEDLRPAKLAKPPPQESTARIELP
jgi:hypothetical protein